MAQARGQRAAGRGPGHLAGAMQGCSPERSKWLCSARELVPSAAFSNARPKKLGTQRHARRPPPGASGHSGWPLPPGPKSSPAQPSGGCAPHTPECPPRPTELCGVGSQACTVGWDGLGEGRGEGAGHWGTGPARLEVEKAIPGLALRLDPLDPAPGLTSFCPSCRSLGGCPPWSRCPAPRSGGRPSPRAAACSAGSLSAGGTRTSIMACARASTPSAQEP